MEVANDNRKFASIKQQLQSLSEDRLRQKVIIPLLRGLGCCEVHDNCGPHEKGKDIIYVHTKHFLRRGIWGAVVLKKDKIDKGKMSVQVNSQVAEAINPFPNPGDPTTKIRVHEIIVITAAEITPAAQDYIYENSGRWFQNIHYIDGERLQLLINEVVGEYNSKTKSDYQFHIETFGTVLGFPIQNFAFEVSQIGYIEGQAIR